MIWALRLTWNCFYRWVSLAEEDWRYNQFRRFGSFAYWFVSLFGFHLMPTFMVTSCCISVYVAMIYGRETPLNGWDLVATFVSSLGIFFEAVADYQMNKFVDEKKSKKKGSEGKIMDQGLWSISRHPNYLGELLFWWGQSFFYVASGFPSIGWSSYSYYGPIALTLLMIGYSIPAMEQRSVEKRPAFKEYQKKTKMLIPYVF